MSKGFEYGQLVATRGVYERMEAEPAFKDFCIKSFARHVFCDWGDVDEEDKRTNDESLEIGERLMSAYIYNKDKDDKIWIITERDRSATTILFPEEY